MADSVEALARIECRELGQRIQKEMSKLYEPYTPITDHQRELLLLQVEAMRSYYDILRTRLAEMEKASNERQRLAAINSKSE